MIDAIVGRVSKFLSLLSSFCIFILILLTAVDVSGRLLRNRPVPGIIEFAEVLLVALIWLGIAQAQRTDAHVSVTLLVSRLPRRVSLAVRAAGLTVMLVIVVWLSVLAIQQAEASVASGEYRWGLMRVPIWPARIAVALGLLALLLETVISLVKMWHEKPDARTTADPAERLTGV